MREAVPAAGTEGLTPAFPVEAAGPVAPVVPARAVPAPIRPGGSAGLVGGALPAAAAVVVAVEVAVIPGGLVAGVGITDDAAVHAGRGAGVGVADGALLRGAVHAG